ncbi:MAG: flippase [Bacteroidota bacterium]
MQLRSFIKRDINLLELFKGGAIALVFKFLSIIIGYLFFIFLARLVDAEGLGIFSTCWTILMIGAVIGKLGFDTSIVKFIAENTGRKSYHHIKPLYTHCMVIVLISSSLVAVLILLTARPLSLLFFDVADKAFIIRIVGLAVIPLALMGYNAESMKGLKKITAFSAFQNGSIYLLTTIIILIFSTHDVNNSTSIIALFIALLILLAVSYQVAAWHIRRVPKASKNMPDYKPDIKSRLNTSLPMLLTNSLFLIMSYIDILMLSAFKAEASVGIYNASLKIAAVISISLVAINSIAAPKYAELFGKNDKAGFRKVVKQTSFLNFSISLPVFLLVVIFPGFLLGVFGEEFPAGSGTLIILAIGQIFSAFSGSTIHILNMTGREKIARNIIMTTAVVNVILNYLLVPPMGITGAAIATTFSTILWNLMSEIVIYRQFGFLTYPLVSLKRAKNIKDNIMKK